MSTTDGNTWRTLYQDPRSTATPPVDDVVERFMATYRASSQQDDGDFFLCVRNALKITVPFWAWVIHRVFFS